MAVTVSYVVLHHLRKEDGTNFIRIRITHKRKSKYLKTAIVVEPSDFTRSGNLKHQGKIDLAKDEVKRIRMVTDKMTTSAQDAMDVDDVVHFVKARLAEEEELRLNVYEYGMRLADKKKVETGNNYRVALRCLVRFFGYEPDISEITVKKMREFEDFIKNETRRVYNKKKGELQEGKAKAKKKDRCVSMYIGIVRAVYNAARMEFNEPDKGVFRLQNNPFEYYKVPVTKYLEHRDIPMEWVQMMIDQRKGLKGRQRLGVDAFLVSFGMMGINTVDMYMSKEKAKDGVVHYFRTKTTDSKEDKAEMYVRLEPCITEIFKDYKGRERLFDYYTRYGKKNDFIVAVNDGLKQWRVKNGLEHFTMYAARHTWATLAASKEVGVDYAVVTEGLTHSDASRKMDQIYIKKDWERVWDANAKVLALFRW